MRVKNHPIMPFVFLLCSERSGSNFLTSLLNGHPDICGPPPSHMFRLFATNIHRYGDLQDNQIWTQLIQDTVAVFDSMLGSWHTQPCIDELAQSARLRSSAELLRLIYEKEAIHDNARLVFVKENYTYQFVPYLLAYFPNCRFVYMVRDPRDVAASWLNTPSMSGGVKRAVDQWTNDQIHSLSIYHQLRLSNRITLVRYEDILVNPERESEHLANWLGLAGHPAMLEYHTHSRTINNANRIKAWSNLDQGVMRNNFAKYSDTLNTADQNYVENRCCELMQQLGYQTEVVKQNINATERKLNADALLSKINLGTHATQSESEISIRSARLRSLNTVLNRPVVPVKSPL